VGIPRVDVWHIHDDRLAELWLHPVDQAAFDQFCRAGAISDANLTTRRSGGMADAADLKSAARKGV
jgi:hypothetical protein